MSERSRPSVTPQVHVPGNSPSPASLRHRGPTRAATLVEGSNIENLRRNSTLSDSVSEARNSIRSSTDDLLFPRVAKRNDGELPDDDSHWQSAPLGLALLPAIAGVFFKNGSAVITDITLLVLAAIFLNWSVRLPWGWYRSAQEIRQDNYSDGIDYSSDLETKEDQDALDDSNEPADFKKERQRYSAAASAASKELHIHELAALASCFIFPIIGTWVLHAIRSKLSRPSEGLVSNYNLTIFLLAAEIRPFSHLLKMVQARTLHLQRVVASSSDEEERIDSGKILDLTKRLEELEAHVAETAAARSPPGSSTQSQRQDDIQSLVSQATAEIRKSIHPEIEALNRAVRRYEKRTAVTNFQTDSRLRELEIKVRDATSLAAAAQRISIQRHRGIISILFDGIYTIVLIPSQVFLSLTMLPIRIATRCLGYIMGKPKQSPSQAKPRKGKSPQYRKAGALRRSQRPYDAETRELRALRDTIEESVNSP